MHPTKVKADIGLCKVLSDLTARGLTPCLPVSEHQPYDVVAVGKDGAMFRLQVKYSSLKKSGAVDVRFRRSWSDSKGTYTRAYRVDEFDYYAIYCPEKDAVVYIKNTATCPKSIRFDKPANQQAQHIQWAHDYLTIPQESSETIRRTPAMVKT